MAKKKKKSNQRPRAFSPISYLKSGSARQLEIFQCLIPEDWEEIKKFPVIVARQHANGKLTFGLFLVDLMCTGVKDAMFKINEPPFEYDFIVDQYNNEITLVECSYNLAHNIIYEALAYAEDWGIAPHEDFELAEMILKEDSEDIPLMDVPLGMDGQPMLMISPDDPKKNYYLKQLERHAGPGNFQVISDDFFDLEDEMDEDEDEPTNWSIQDWVNYLQMDVQYMLPFDNAVALIYERCIYKPEFVAKQLGAVDHLTRHECRITFNALEGSASQANTSLHLSYHQRLHRTDLTKRDIKELVYDLKQEVKKKPNDKVLHNYLYNALKLSGSKREAEKLLENIIVKFPDYLFGKLSLGMSYLEEGLIDAIPGIFNGSVALPAVFPERKEFHFSEFIGFNTLMGFYFLRKGDLNQAYLYHKMMEDTDLPDEFTPPLEFTTSILERVYSEVKPLVTQAQENGKKMEELLVMLEDN